MVRELYFALIAFASPVASGAAIAQDWTSPNAYPSRAVAVEFDNGLTLDRGRSINYGAWNVRFSGASLAGKFTTPTPPPGSPAAPQIWLEGLLCSNKSEGEKPGRIMIVRMNSGNLACWISCLPDPLIGCPRSVRLEQ